MSVAVFYKGEIIHTYNYGYQDVGNKILANDNTKYRIASISKTISTMGLMRLYDLGYFNLSDSITEKTGINYDSNKGVITFKDLLTHTAGIYDSETYWRACDGARLTTSQVISNSHAGYEVGSTYQYTNICLGSVGAIIETFVNDYFSNYMRDFFVSLNMDASYASDLIDDQDSMAILYSGSASYNPKTWVKKTKFYESYGIGNGYLQADGELMISASDLAKLASILANGGKINDETVLSEEAVNLILTNYIDVYDDEGNYKYTEGLACHNFKGLVDGKNNYGHTGSALGVVTGMYFDPDEGSGVVILDNGASIKRDANNNVKLLNEILEETYDRFFKQ